MENVYIEIISCVKALGVTSILAIIVFACRDRIKSIVCNSIEGFRADFFRNDKKKK